MLRTLSRIFTASLFLWIAAYAVAAIPTLTSISPASAYENGPSFTLTANGTNFVSGATIYFDYNTPLTTTFVNSTQLTAVVPASFLTQTNSLPVWVVNPDFSQTGTLYFTVVARTPSISSTSPTSIVAGSATTLITVNGQNFMSGARVLVNNFPIQTTYVDSQTLQFTATKAQLSQARMALISVSNPPPGGTSSAMNFNVTYPAKVGVLNLPANDIVWDPYAQRIYASLPSSYGSRGNSIAVIDPSSGRISSYHFAGSEPNQLAISADSKYLYVGLNGSSSVQRFILPSFAPDIVIPLASNGAANLAGALSVDPADSHTLAVVQTSNECCFNGGTFFYKDATQLPDNITYPSISEIVFANGSTAYGYYNGDLTQINVDSNGGTAGQQWNGLVTGSYIQYAAGLIYGNGGEVLNPATGFLVGTYDVGSSCCFNSGVQVLPDGAINRVFAAGYTPFFSQFGITTYDLKKFTPIAIADLSQFSGSPLPAFVQWGSSGLAFILQPQCCGNYPTQIVLVQSPAMFSNGTSNSAAAVKSLSPGSVTHGSGNLLVTLKGTNFVSGSQVTWNGVSLFAEYVSAKQLNLYVPRSLLASPATADITVVNPVSHGESASVRFTIN